eukprot:scaffold248570_cov73-Attheya_sp.AAC.1
MYGISWLSSRIGLDVPACIWAHRVRIWLACPMVESFRMCFNNAWILAAPCSPSRSLASIPPKNCGPNTIFRGKLLWYPSWDSSRGNSVLCSLSSSSKENDVDASGHIILAKYIVL